MIRKIIVGTLLLSVAISACKKGENDPSLSLRTRKARVAGEWKVTSGKGSSQQNGPWGASTSSWTFDGTTYSTTIGTGAPYAESRMMEFTFEKDGKYQMVDTWDGTKVTYEGDWNFNKGVGEAEGKSELLLSLGKLIEDGITYDVIGHIHFESYVIDELRNDKMVLTKESKSTSSSGSVYTDNEEWVLEPR